eukprot:CAMPEP_0115080094 /NCGR_PEP_ID=MMETSP0227-20121206/18487_1 /TAXON_ID=89957 /ORGANISM="Polarella glacialis, Strain CCMP 1383" /LENGTH=1738 /DNA_ID=CAMNT_0002467699 /DNA_START=420 /DNA_END=5636 /DNA_ORIENTATION=-
MMDIDSSEVAARTAAAAAVPVPGLDSPGDFVEHAYRVVDAKPKLPHFAGAEKDFLGFYRKMQGIARTLGIRDLLQKIEDSRLMDLDLLTPSEGCVAAVWYQFLCEACEPSSVAGELVALDTDENGFAAWRRLVDHFRPKTHVRQTASLCDILEPKWRPDKPFWSQLLQWELDTVLYERESGQKIPSAVKCSTIARHAPVAVRRYLADCEKDLTTSYVDLRGALEQRELRRKIFAVDNHIENGPVPMEIDLVNKLLSALYDKGKGKGPGKGKGKGQGKGKGKQEPGKGKGKGKEQKGADLQRKGKGKGKQDGKGTRPWTTTTTPQYFDGWCRQCNKYGHKAATCWSVSGLHPATSPIDLSTSWDDLAAEVRGGEEETWALTEAATEVLELDWVSRQPKDEKQRHVLLMVDSGSFAHVCYPDFASWIPLQPLRTDLKVRTASGAPVKVLGQRLVMLEFPTCQTRVMFIVCESVTRAILSTGLARKSRVRTHFGPEDEDCWMKQGTTKIPLLPIDTLFFAPATILSRGPARALGPGWLESEAGSRQAGRDATRKPKPTAALLRLRSTWEAKEEAELLGEDGDDAWEQQLQENIRWSDQQTRRRREEFEERKEREIQAMEEAEEPMEEAEEQEILPDVEARASADPPVAKVPKPLAEPTPEERRRHEATHVPYQPWCRICVSSRGIAAPHRDLQAKVTDPQPMAVPVLALDFTFLKGVVGEKGGVVLAGVCDTGMYGFATSLTSKGGPLDRPVEAVLRYCNEAALHGTLRARTDGEPSITRIAAAVATARAPAQTVVEIRPPGEPDAKGAVERWIREVCGVVRSLGLMVEARWKKALGSQSPALPWAVRHAAFLINRYQPRRRLNDETAFHRLHRKDYDKELFNFCEAVLAATSPPSKLEERFTPGVWLGRTVSSDQHIVGASSGIVLTRTCRRLSDADCPPELYDQMAFTPWMPTLPAQRPREEEVKLPQPAADPAAEPLEPDVWSEPADGTTEGFAGPRATTLRPEGRGVGARCRATYKELQRFLAEAGVTPGCKACSHGGAQRHHTTTCDVRRSEWKAKQTPDASAAAAPPTWSGTAPHTQGGVGAAAEYRPQVGRRESPKRVREEADEEMLEEMDWQPGEELRGVKRRAEGDAKPDEEEFVEVSVVTSGPPFYDTITGKELRPELVEAGMQKERGDFKRYGVFQETTRSAYKKAKEADPEVKLVKCGWVLVEKITDTLVRSRMVATEVSDGGWRDIYTPTPSSPGRRLLFAWGLRHGYAFETGDVSVAFLHAPLVEKHRVFIIPPKTEGLAEDVLWEAKQSIYGLRQSPRAFGDFFGAVFAKLGWQRSSGDPQLYFNKVLGAPTDGTPTPRNRVCLCSVRTDDPIFASPRDLFPKLKAEIDQHLQMKWFGELGSKRVKYLGSEIRFHEEAVDLRIPDVYYASLLEEAGMQTCKGTKTTGPTQGTTARNARIWPDPLSTGMHRLYRRIVGRLMWVTPYRPDMFFAIKERARDCSAPAEASWMSLKHLLRYVRQTRGCYLRLEVDPAAPEDQVICWSDASWAASADRRSTSGGLLMWCGVVITSWSRTQKVPALSSSEAETIALATAGCEAMWLVSVLRELGVPTTIHGYIDAKATLGHCYRLGPGNMKHIDLRTAWLQHHQREGTLKLHYTPAAENLADVLTKVKPAARQEEDFDALGLRYEEEEPEVKEKVQRPRAMQVNALTGEGESCPRCSEEMWLDISRHEGAPSEEPARVVALG